MEDQRKPAEVLKTELDRMLERMFSNYDLSYAEVVGILIIKATELSNKTIQ